MTYTSTACRRAASFNHELQRNFFASLEIPNLGRYVGKERKINELLVM